MKTLYVRLVRALRSVLAATGLLRVLDGLAARSRTALWVRSWLAVYDLEDLLRLDTPWWTFEASDRVETFLRARPDAQVFEWGSGASTVWLAARAGHVTSVEHDAEWAHRMRAVLPANADLLLAPPAPVGPGPAVGSRKAGFAGLDFSAYVDRIDAVGGDLDLVVVDGRAREACLAKALPRLARGGLLVLDNVERARYRDALRAHPEVEVEWTSGRTPALPYPTRTALVGVRR